MSATMEDYKGKIFSGGREVSQAQLLGNVARAVLGKDRTADLKRLLFVREAEESASLHYRVVVNWTAELKR